MAGQSTKIRIDTPDGPVCLNALWFVRQGSSIRRSYTNVDILLNVDPDLEDSSSLTTAWSLPTLSNTSDERHKRGDQSLAAIEFLIDCCSTFLSPNVRCQRAVKLILPALDGYISKSNILEQRLVDCPGIASVRSFCRPRQYLRSLSGEQIPWTGLLQLLSHAVGAILLEDRLGSNPLSAVLALDVELEKRLSYPWISKNPIARKSLAFVDGRNRASTEPMLRSAITLGIEMTVLGDSGHWLESHENAALDDHFLPLDMTNDDYFPLRIVETFRKQRIQWDSMTSNYDWLTVPVSQAAAFLGLPHESLTALDICRDKYKQKMISGDPALQVRKGDDTETVVDDSFDFPVVVKPSGGLNSEGVSKVYDHNELKSAVDRVFDSQYDHMSDVNAVNVEEYCSGPEVDVNFVLLDGKVLFAEVADDFPKAGDGDRGAKSTVFKESAMVYPSALPAEEVEMLKASLHQTLLDMGLRTGVYHVEARVSNSRKRYVTRDGLVDLEDVTGNLPDVEPGAVLIEVNARLPGDMCKAAVSRAYGVDYNDLHLLLALGENERAEALSQPFLGGPQYWCETLFIVADKGGIFDSDGLYEDLEAQCPELAESVCSSFSYYKRGDVVPEPTPDSQPWIAWLLVFSRESRRDLLVKADKIQREVKVPFNEIA